MLTAQANPMSLEFKHPAHEVFRAEEFYASLSGADPRAAAGLPTGGKVLMEPHFDQSSIANTLRGAIENGHFTLEDLDQPSAWLPEELQTRQEDLPERLRGRSAPQPPARRLKPLTAAQRAPQDTLKHLPRPDPNPNSDPPF